jgi:hypothetical protein
MKNKTPWAVAAIALSLPVLSQAQSDPASSKTSSAAPRYESAFTDYSRWQDVSAGDWRAANDAVGTGSAAVGHAGHRAPAAPLAPAAASTPAAAAKMAPAASGHEGHTMHGGQK